MIKNIDVFEKDPIPKAVFKLAIPTVLSMIVAVFYNMVDTFFVGRTGDPNQVAAVSVATPVFLFFMAAGNIFGMGGSSFLSRALGEKQYDKAKKISSFCLYAGLITGILGAILMLTFMTQILHAVGTSENTFGFAKSYLSWIAYGGPAIVISTAFTNLIRGEGAAQSSMKGMMAGTVANIILDPVFILDSFFGIPCLGLGVAGAAIATVIGNLVSIVIYFAHVLKPTSILTLSPKYFAVRNGILKGVLLIGLPASITNILMSLSNILMNKFLVVYGDFAVTGMGIAMKANMLVVFVQLGLAAGMQPLVGYNFGARNFKRMKGVMKFSILSNIISGVLLTILYLIFTQEIVSVFIKNPSDIVIETGVKMLRALMFSSPLLGILFVLNFSFQAMGKAKESLALAISRQGFVFVPCTIIMNKLIGLEGLILSQPIADIVS
ncbi:MAG: MATE family efflux transporter, partial [Treponema sp.]|nr:MATE family efflux transporter [Treponema sp.]